MAKTDFEKAIETISLVEENLVGIAATKFEKADQSSLHPVKRLVQGANGQRYYRTYWVADHQLASQAQSDAHSMSEHKKNMEGHKQDLDKRPDDDWYQRRYNEAKERHDKAAARLQALETDAVKTEDKKFSTKNGKSLYDQKSEELKKVEEEIAQNSEAWKQWSKEGPEKVREQAKEDYKKAWKEAGLDITDDYGHFQGKVMSSDGKTELLTIQHSVDYNFKSEGTDYIPNFEVRLRHSSFNTKDKADFAYMKELSDSLAKVSAVTSDPVKMKQLDDIRMTAHNADKTDTKNEFSSTSERLNKRKRELENEIKEAKIDDVISEIGNDSFELKDEYYFETGRKYAPRYNYAKVIKTTPKQVVVGFTDRPGSPEAYYSTKNMNTADFRKFIANHVDLDAHLPHYTGESTDEVKGAKVETAEHKDTAKKLGVKPEKLGKMVNEDHKKEQDAKNNTEAFALFHATAKKLGGASFNNPSQVQSVFNEMRDDYPKAAKFLMNYTKDFGYSKFKDALAESAPDSSLPKAVADARKVTTSESKPAPASNTGEKKVVGHDNYNHPQYGEYNKGDEVTFEHKGEMKGGKVIRVNEYQRFPNPYVLMEGSDGKKYEIVISKVNVYKDKEDAGGASGKK